MKIIKRMLVYIFLIVLTIIGVILNSETITTIGILLFILTLIGSMIKTVVESGVQSKQDQDVLSTIAATYGFQKIGTLLKGVLNGREIIIQKRRAMVADANASSGINVLRIETWANRLDEQLSKSKAIQITKPIIHILSGHIMKNGFQFSDPAFMRRFIVGGTIGEENANKVLDVNIQNKLNALYEKGYIYASSLFDIIVIPESLTRAKITATFPIPIIEDSNTLKIAMDLTTDIASHIENIRI